MSGADLFTISYFLFFFEEIYRINIDFLTRKSLKEVFIIRRPGLPDLGYELLQ